MSNKFYKTGNKGFFKKLLSSLLSLALLLSVVPFAPVSAKAAGKHYDGYKFKITIDVTNDADGWNSASLTLYALEGGTYNGGGTRSDDVASYDIKSEIDSASSFCTKEIDCGDAFPEKAVIYTDFGGGFTWREWGADVKLYINDYLVKTEHVVSTSAAFSTSNDTDVITIDKSFFPTPQEFTKAYNNDDPDDYNFYQQESDGNNCIGSISYLAYDQYGVAWRDYALIKSETYPENEGINSVYGDINEKYTYYVKSNTGTDHRSKFSYTLETSNSVVPTVTLNFDIYFHFLHSLELKLDGEHLETYKNYSGEQMTLPDVDYPTGYHFSDYYVTGVGTFVEDEKLFMFGEGDAEIDIALSANTYKIHFDGNGADTGKMTDLSCTYDKTKKLTANKFKKENKAFVGWNTKADNTGQSYDNTAQVKNLSSTDKDTITLYAQWADIPHDVHYEYSEEFTNAIEQYNASVPEEQRIVLDYDIVVNQGDNAAVEQCYNVNDAEKHYQFTASSSSLENITDDENIMISYSLVDHDFDDPVITKHETCTEDGEEYQICKGCGYKKITVRPAEHQGLTTIPKVSPTCTVKGSTEGVRCDACNSVVTAPEEIKAEGHEYGEPVWEWSEDFNYVKATWTCTKCGEKVSRNSIDPSEIRHQDVGVDRVYSITFPLNGKSYTGTATYKNLYSEIPYVDENGEENTLVAARLEEGKTPVGKAFFVDHDMTLTDPLVFTEDTKLVICDGVTLTIDLNNKNADGIKAYNSTYESVNGGPKYAKDFKLYGETNQTGKLIINVEDTSDSYSGISCGGYYQYGANVNIYCNTKELNNFPGESNAIYAHGYARHDSNIEVHRGILNAYSKNGEALFCYHKNIILDGGKVTATNGNENHSSVVTFEAHGMTFGCSSADDFLNLGSVKMNDGGYYTTEKISVKSGQTLTDGHSLYTGDLSDEQVAALAGKKLKLHYGHKFGEPDWTWGHNYSTASATFKCADCDYTTDVDASVDSEVTLEPTCGEAGERTYTASVTMNETTYTDEQTEPISATGNHNLVHYPKKAQTDFVNGNIEYWVCNTCMKYFTDEACQNEVSQQDTVIKSNYTNLTIGDIYRLEEKVYLRPYQIIKYEGQGNHSSFYYKNTKLGTYFSDSAGYADVENTGRRTLFNVDSSKSYTGLYKFIDAVIGVSSAQPLYVDTDYEPEWNWNGTESATITFSHFVCRNEKIEYEQTEDAEITFVDDYENNKRTYTATFNSFGTSFTDSKTIDVEGYYTLSFESNGGSGNMEDIKFIDDEKVKLPECTFTHSDYYDFVGWKIGNTVYGAGEKVTLNEDTVATAQWKAHEWNLFVSGHRINSNNYSDLMGDGTVVYDPSTNTITLTNATLEAVRYSTGLECAVRSNENNGKILNIVLVGENKIVNEATENDTTSVYGILAFDNNAGFNISGSGSLDISFNANGEGVTYTGIETRKSTVIDGTNISINIPGIAVTYGYNIVYTNTLTLKNSAALSILTGSNEGTYSMFNNRDADNLSVEIGSVFEAASDNAAFNSQNKVTSKTKELGVGVNVKNSKTGLSQWDGTTNLSNYKYIGIPVDSSKIPDNGSNLSLTDKIETTVYIDAEAYGVDVSTAVIKATYNHNNASSTPDVRTDVIPVSELEQYSGTSTKYVGDYMFTYSSAPAQLTEECTIALYASSESEEPLYTESYSAKSYCDKVNALYEKTENPDESLTKLNTLCNSLVDYAKASQLQFNYSKDLTEDYRDERVQSLTAGDIEATANVKTSDVYGFAFDCQDELNILVYTNSLVEPTGVSINATKYADKINAAANKKDSTSFIRVRGLGSGNINKVVTINTANGDVTVSANAIVKAYLGANVSSEMKDLARAIYLYGAAAADYFGA